MDKSGREDAAKEFEDLSTAGKTDGFSQWARRGLSSEYAGALSKQQGLDWPFLALTLALLLIGLVMVLSASFVRSSFMTGEPMMFFSRQLAFAASGTALMLITAKLKVSLMSRWSLHLLVVSVLLLVLVLFAGVKVNGARRWIGFGGENGAYRFQPSEIAKVAVILSFSQLMCKFGGKRMKTFKYGVLPFACIACLMAALLAREPHYSAAIIVLAISAIMMFAGGTGIRWFIIAFAVLAALFCLLLLKASPPGDESGELGVSERLGQTKWSEKLGYAGSRIDAWLNPDADPLGDGFQIRQSLFAVGSGGLLGQGLGRSRQKYLYLPEEYNDYIFAIVCEELGFIGAMLILSLFLLLIIRGYWLALHAKDKFSSLITIGITSLLAIQVFLNVAVVINLIPATGISLPFFSYGGTALWIQLVEMGIVLAVSREIPAAV